MIYVGYDFYSVRSMTKWSGAGRPAPKLSDLLADGLLVTHWRPA